MEWTTKEITELVEKNPDIVQTPEDTRILGEWFLGARWRDLQYDMNGDELFTISDVAGWLYWTFTLPGDMALIATMMWAPGLALFLEIGLGGWLSIGISIVAWIVVLILVAQVFSDPLVLILLFVSIALAVLKYS